MPDRDWRLLLQDMLHASRKIHSNTSDIDFQSFCKDEWLRDAILHNILIIGEAANHLPIRFKEQFNEINWREIVNMRNIIVHEYFGIDLNLMWKTTKEDIPLLTNQLSSLLKDLNNQ